MPEGAFYGQEGVGGEGSLEFAILKIQRCQMGSISYFGHAPTARTSRLTPLTTAYRTPCCSGS
jgi:hypothetical protein